MTSQLHPDDPTSPPGDGPVPPLARMPRTGDPRGSLVHVTLRYTIPMPLAFVGLSNVVIQGDAARRIEWSP